MRNFVIGDIHGGYRGLKQVLERAGVDYENDRVIQLGDVADGWSETPECVEELLLIKNLVSIAGNHDLWCRDWLNDGETNKGWLMQGGQATYDAYIRTGLLVSYQHKKFFRDQKPYHLAQIDGENVCFTHGGFHRHHSLDTQADFDFAWDRDLFLQAMTYEKSMTPESKAKYGFRMCDGIQRVYIGHTPVQHFGSDTPLVAGPITNMDTGAAFKGKLSIMDINTKEVWQSDPLFELYPEERGRN